MIYDYRIITQGRTVIVMLQFNIKEVEMQLKVSIINYEYSWKTLTMED